MDANQLLLTRPPILRSCFREGPAAENIPVVFVADEDACVRDMLESLLAPLGWRAQSFVWSGDLPEPPRTLTPSCMVLDISLAPAHGLQVQHCVTVRAEMPIILLSQAGDVRTAVQAMKAGAHECLTKPVSGELLLTAIRDAVERSRAALVRRATLDVLRNGYATLTPREREVMALVVCGRLNKQIAGELGISEITVKAHRGSMMRKMAVRTVPDLVKVAAKLFPAD